MYLYTAMPKKNHDKQLSILAVNLAKRRKQMGLTQQRFGLMLGFPEDTAYKRISQYERGYREPEPDLLRTMAGILKTTPSQLRGLTDETDEHMMDLFKKAKSFDLAHDVIDYVEFLIQKHTHKK